MEYYERMKSLRTRRKMTQEELCDEIMIRQRSYSDYEKGRTHIPIDLLIRLAEFYDVSMDYICGISEKEDRFLHQT
ncbi:MAG: helix-turn-helix transcriptional regulator [Lachnospiraceae bacterium]|nr:helix-turn-helix transcriptional regulator [Lachnospiraceae bacterium]